MKNIAYKIRIKLLSALSIGSGKGNNTDSDVVVDRKGQPYIPATAITGVLRSYVHSVNEKIELTVFGDTEEKIKTLIRVYDARLDKETDDFFIAVRHRVALENKVAKKGAKFDLEAVEPDDSSVFTSFIQFSEAAFGPEKHFANESDQPEEEKPTFDDCVNMVEQALSALASGVIGLGSDTSRGYGRVQLTVYKKNFDNVEDFLDFDIFESNNWAEVGEYTLPTAQNSNMKLTVNLQLVSAISIREYSTKPGSPDYAMMSLHKINDAPVIPGTSWAGAFRARFAQFAGEEEAKKVFGFVDQKNNSSKKAEISFSESQISGGTYKDVTRNSLDRFSMATKTGALYMERTYYGGETQLSIILPDKAADMTVAAIGACLMDLDRGFLAVGGLTSVGRGLFKITGISSNGKDGEKLLSAVKNGNVIGFVEALKGEKETAENE